MSTFKCKMCGGTLEIEDKQTVAICEYCGTQQTVPTSVDENLQSVYNRANTLRIKSEFDKAEKLYEKILQIDSKQSEAYWGLILCKYGIEYVDDPATLKKIPTCHRASFESVIADDDYKSALEYADTTQRAVYEEQAREIDRIQKEILALAQKEESYDVFICYKETDSNGQRTQDSVIANDIYYQLTEHGFKVFYAAITLEGKLGSAYEPIIFAALNSAKVMLVIGTDPEHFNAVWVKNEWSRYLKIITKDRSKLLIPCYRDMDAYELPEEFAHLQAQDMGKIGFINDVVRGIQKVIKKDEPKQTTVVKETVVKESVGVNVDSLLKRAFMFLEDGEWDSANEYCEKVLDIDPECAEAYLGKLMAELHIRKQGELKDFYKPFDDNKNYHKMMQFANDSLKTTITQYLENIKKGISAEMNDFIKNAEIKDGTVLKYNGNAKSICLSQNITSIEKGAFGGCSALTSITIPDSVTKIASYAFRGCSSLTSITIPSSVTCIDSYAFSDCSSLTSITIPSGVTSIASYAFHGCSALTSITIPDSVTKISSYAFSDCSSLTSITIPSGVTSIGSHVFHDCSALTSIAIPDSVTEIAKHMFDGCSSLTSITIPSGVTRIQSYAFHGCSALTSITIPDSLHCIFEGAFQGCSSLVDFVIPDSVNYIDKMAFYECSSLKTITIPYDVKSVMYETFGRCTSLTSVTLKYGIESIENFAFECCTSLTSIEFPKTVRKVGQGSFKNCSSLVDVHVGDYFSTFIDSTAFNGTPYATQKYTNSSTSKGGCYVATAIYGSYDCPQVWTLRRYRDNTLASTWYGRAFIHTYYAISPTLVKWFGDTKWFKKMWQGKLDRMVAKLNAEGVEDTPYEDKNWR